MTFPTLYHKSKTEALVQWTVSVEGDDVCTEYGQVGGKMQFSRKKATPKNAGKANATTGHQQAIAEATALHKHRLDRKYSLTPEDASEPVLLPMLAKKYDPKKVKFPVYVQPKLDGFRCLAFMEEGKVRLVSRSGKEFNLPHIQDILMLCMYDGEVLDGELYIHGETFQTISSLVKRSRPGTENIQYHIYDFPRLRCVVPGVEFTGPDSPYSERLERFQSLGIVGCYTRDVTTRVAHSDKEVWDIHDRYVEHGYEGAIVRKMNMIYEFGFKSSNLLKVKIFEDAEFKIIGGGPGKGKFANKVIYQCVTADGKIFDVTPKGSAENREELLRSLRDDIGKELTVRYFGLTDDGKPRFPVGVGIREDFDK